MKTCNWVPLPGFEDHYIINESGDIKSIKRNKILHKQEGVGGYIYTCISANNKKHNLRVHVCVAKAFIPNPLGLPEVNHKDGIKAHVHKDNLEWSTASANTIHAFDCGLSKVGENHGRSKLTSEQVTEIRARYKPRDPIHGIRAMAREFGVSPSTLSSIIKGKHRVREFNRETQSDSYHTEDM